MSWVVKDTAKLSAYGFKIERHYNDDNTDEYIGSCWSKIVMTEFFRTVWLEVFEDDVGVDGSITEADHRLYLEDTNESIDDEKWQYALPTLSKLYQEGVIEWRK